MATSSSRRGTGQSDWIGLGEASRALGVNESTLRRWADAGAVRTFRTPGGHRRFFGGDLLRLTEEARHELREFDGEAIERIRARLDGDNGAPPAWLVGLGADVRNRLAELGRETVALVERYLSSTADRPALEAAAAALGRRYAALLREAGVTLTDAVAAFAYFRRGMDEAVRTYAGAHGLPTDVAAGLWERVAVLEDHLLVALTGGYDDSSRMPAVSGAAGGPGDRESTDHART